MKKVRSILILALAAMMLSVFVGCAPEPEVNNNNGGNTPAVEDKLVITKFFLGLGNKNDIPEGYDPLDYNAKLFAITNKGTTDIELDQYGMGYSGKNKDKEDVSNAYIFPSSTLKPGATLYVVNTYKNGHLFLFNMLPNLQTLPKIADTPIITDEAIWLTDDVRFKNTSFALELAKDIDTSVKDKNTWTTIDTVKIESKDLDGKALLRNDDLTWTSLDWLKNKEELTKLDSKKGPNEASKPDVSYAKFKTEILTPENPATETPYAYMSAKEFDDFKKAALADGCIDASRDRYSYAISVEYAKGSFATVTSSNVITKGDFSFDTLEPHILAYAAQGDKYNSKLPKTNYSMMPYNYTKTFAKEAIGKHSSWIVSASDKGLSITTDDKIIEQDKSGKWSIKDYVKLETVAGNGDLVITRTLRTGQNKFIAFTNTKATGSTNLSEYQIVITINNTPTSFKFPANTTLKAGNTIFLVSSNGGCKDLKNISGLKLVAEGKENGNCKLTIDMNSWNNKDGDSICIKKGEKVVQGLDSTAIGGWAHTREYAEGAAAETAKWVEYKEKDKATHFDVPNFWLESKPAAETTK